MLARSSNSRRVSFSAVRSSWVAGRRARSPTGAVSLVASTATGRTTAATYPAHPPLPLLGVWKSFASPPAAFRRRRCWPACRRRTVFDLANSDNDFRRGPAGVDRVGELQFVHGAGHRYCSEKSSEMSERFSRMASASSASMALTAVNPASSTISTVRRMPRIISSSTTRTLAGEFSLERLSYWCPRRAVSNFAITRPRVVTPQSRSTARFHALRAPSNTSATAFMR